LRINHSYQ